MEIIKGINNRKLFFIINVLKKTSQELNNLPFLKKLHENFYSTLIGLTNVCRLIVSDSELSELLITILYLRLISGLEISIIKEKNRLFIVNMNGIYETEPKYFAENDLYEECRKAFFEKAITKINQQKSYPEVKENILKSLENASVFSTDCQIKNFVIFTCNRPLSLQSALEEYIDNFKEFGHENIRIIISDDSNEQFIHENKLIVNKFKETYQNIIHFDQENKTEMINGFIKKFISVFPEYKEHGVSNLINYIFGGNKFYHLNFV